MKENDDNEKNIKFYHMHSTSMVMASAYSVRILN
jgi:hypothetical protein